MAVKIPAEENPIVVGSGGEGVAVAEILDDPFITAGERIIFATHTKQLVINGYGFVLDDTRVTLTPTLPDAYYLDTVEPYRITLRLRDGYSWCVPLRAFSPFCLFGSRCFKAAGCGRARASLLPCCLFFRMTSSPSLLALFKSVSPRTNLPPTPFLTTSFVSLLGPTRCGPRARPRTSS
jgi:hypothetical protein